MEIEDHGLSDNVSSFVFDILKISFMVLASLSTLNKLGKCWEEKKNWKLKRKGDERRQSRKKYFFAVPSIFSADHFSFIFEPED